MAAGKRVMFDLFIKRIPFTVECREVRQYFLKFGEVERCYLRLNRDTGLYTGNGWLKFRNPENATAVLETEDHILGGYKITIEKHEQRFYIHPDD